MTSTTPISSSFNQAIDAYKKANKQAIGHGRQPSAEDQLIKQTDGLGVLHTEDKIDVIAQGSTKSAPFSSIIQEVIEEKCQKIKKSEKVAVEAIKGKTNMVEVMAAINESEIALQEMITVRDKIISAYLDILKMPL